MSRPSSSRRPGFPAKIQLGTSLIGLAILGLILALIAQGQRAAERERRLRSALAEALSTARGDRGKREFLGDLGIVILGSPSRVELLRVGRIPPQTSEEQIADLGTPAGREFDAGFATRLAGALLDPKHYGFINADDLADPQLGFRFWRGKESLDILISRQGSTPGSPHQDVWASTRDERGTVVHRGYQVCLNSARLEELIGEATGARRPSPELRP